VVESVHSFHSFYFCRQSCGLEIAGRSQTAGTIPDLSGQGRNGNSIYVFPDEVLRRKLSLIHAHVQTMVRDRVTALADFVERSGGQFRKHRKFPHAVDWFHQIAATSSMNDGE